MHTIISSTRPSMGVCVNVTQSCGDVLKDVVRIDTSHDSIVTVDLCSILVINHKTYNF